MADLRDNDSQHPEIPYLDANPMSLLCRNLQVERRSNANRSYWLLRGFLFLAPTVSVWVIAVLVLDRDIALAMAGAFFGVQMARPYERWRRANVAFIRTSREEHLTVWQWMLILTSNILDGRAMYIAGEYRRVETESGDLHVYAGGDRMGPRYLPMLIKVRLIIEPDWRRHFIDTSRVVLPDRRLGPSATLKHGFSQNRFPLYSYVCRWRARRTLQLVGKSLLQLNFWKRNADAPAQHLAVILGLPYKTPSEPSRPLRKFLKGAALLLLSIAWVATLGKSESPRGMLQRARENKPPQPKPMNPNQLGHYS